MKILVSVKRVVDHNIRVRVKADGSGVDLANVKMAMNPFDEIAIEEALRLKEAGLGSEVVAVSIGPDKAQEQLRQALAMGADKAILVRTDVAVEPLAVAKLLKMVAVEEGVQLAILGKQAIDDDANQTGQMLAALLQWSQGTFASELRIEGGRAIVVREVDGGLQTIELGLPAVITADLRLNEPRYASLPNIMKAKNKPLAVRPADDFGVDLSPRLETIAVSEPAQRGVTSRVENVAMLLDKLKNEAGVLA